MLTILIAAGLFAGMLLVVVAGYLNVEDQRAREDRKRMSVQAVENRCMLCNAPLPRHASSDEVVVEIERKIDLDIAAVTNWLNPAPSAEVLKRVYRS